MTQTSNRLFDELARLMTDAASVAQGVRREAETVFRTQMERWIADLDLVKREDFDVVRGTWRRRRAARTKTCGAGGGARGAARYPAKPRKPATDEAGPAEPPQQGSTRP